MTERPPFVKTKYQQTTSAPINRKQARKLRPMSKRIATGKQLGLRITPERRRQLDLIRSHAHVTPDTHAIDFALRAVLAVVIRPEEHPTPSTPHASTEPRRTAPTRPPPSTP